MSSQRNLIEYKKKKEDCVGGAVCLICGELRSGLSRKKKVKRHHEVPQNADKLKVETPHRSVGMQTNVRKM